jgi:hypothetical protein
MSPSPDMRANAEQAHAKGKLPMDHGVWWTSSWFTGGNQFPTKQHGERVTVGGNRLYEMYFSRLPE